MYMSGKNIYIQNSNIFLFKKSHFIVMKNEYPLPSISTSVEITIDKFSFTVYLQSFLLPPHHIDIRIFVLPN